MSLRSILICLAAGASAAPAAQNVIGNPGFEQSSSSPAPWSSDNLGPSLFKVVQPGKDSANALSVGYNLSAIGSNFRQDFSVPSNGTYFLSLDYKFGKTGDVNTSLSTQTTGGNGVSVNRRSTKQSTEWTTFTDYSEQSVLTDVPGAGIYLTYFRDSDKPKAAAIFDNFSFKKVTPRVQAGAVELLKNGGFERKRLAPWFLPYTTNDSSISIVNGESGRALQITPVLLSTVLGQNVTLKKGGHYKLTLDFNQPSAPTQQSFASIALSVGAAGDVNTVEGERSGFYGSDVLQAGNGVFTRYFVAGGGKTEIQLNFQYGLFDNSTWGPFTVDNVSLKEVVKP